MINSSVTVQRAVAAVANADSFVFRPGLLADARSEEAIDENKFPWAVGNLSAGLWHDTNVSRPANVENNVIIGADNHDGPTELASHWLDHHASGFLIT